MLCKGACSTPNRCSRLPEVFLMPYRPGTCEAKSQTGQIEAKRGWPAGAPATIRPWAGRGKRRGQGELAHGCSSASKPVAVQCGRLSPVTKHCQVLRHIELQKLLNLLFWCEYLVLVHYFYKCHEEMALHHLRSAARSLVLLAAL